MYTPKPAKTAIRFGNTVLSPRGWSLQRQQNYASESEVNGGRQNTEALKDGML
jgi:hypothetical protein